MGNVPDNEYASLNYPWVLGFEIEVKKSPFANPHYLFIMGMGWRVE